MVNTSTFAPQVTGPFSSLRTPPNELTRGALLVRDTTVRGDARYSLSSVLGAERMALCFFFTSSTLLAILSIICRISSTCLRKSVTTSVVTRELHENSHAPLPCDDVPRQVQNKKREGETSKTVHISDRCSKSTGQSGVRFLFGDISELSASLFCSEAISCIQ